MQAESQTEQLLLVSAVVEVSQVQRYLAALQAEPEELLELPVVEPVLELVRQELVLARPVSRAALVVQVQVRQQVQVRPQVQPQVAWGLE